MRKTKKALWIVLVIFAVLISIIVLYFHVINPVVIDQTRLTIESFATKAINKSVNEISINQDLYSQLINLTHKDDGSLAFIQIKSYEANKICNDIVVSTEAKINDRSSNVTINAGVFSGVPILSGIGQNINLHFNQVGTVNCKFVSKFVSAGINQNIHRLYVEVNTKIGVAFPFHTEIVEVGQQVLLCENIIIGNIPNTYLQSTELDSLLNLVPS